MAIKSLRTGPTNMTLHSKRIVAEHMIVRGEQFVGAALLLKQRTNYGMVVHHLICQGLEVFLRGVLLRENYNKYNPLMRFDRKTKVGFGHDLVKLVAAACDEFELKHPRASVAAQLTLLSSLYSQHVLRYAGAFDVIFGHEYISSSLVLRKLAASVRLARRVGRHAI